MGAWDLSLILYSGGKNAQGARVGLPQVAVAIVIENFKPSRAARRDRILPATHVDRHIPYDTLTLPYRLLPEPA